LVGNNIFGNLVTDWAAKGRKHNKRNGATTTTGLCRMELTRSGHPMN